jgi:hypothetical protein
MPNPSSDVLESRNFEACDIVEIAVIQQAFGRRQDRFHLV